MTMHRTAAFACTVALGACTLSACMPKPEPATDRVSPHASTRSADDSLRAIVERIGSEPATQLLARGVDGASCALEAGASLVPAAIVGLEVVLWGKRTDAPPPMLPGANCSFAMARFAVRAVDGVPAVDGILRADGASFALEGPSGERLALREVPAALRAQVGARIFWAGPLDRAPAAYGVLQEARP